MSLFKTTAAHASATHNTSAAAAEALSRHNALQRREDGVTDALLSSGQTTPQLLQFNIALNVSQAAGLGVSVKGKTTSQPSTSQPQTSAQKDLGIFIKDIIAGGAAQLVRSTSALNSA